VTVIKYEKIKINLVVANQTINKLYYSATFLVIFVLDRFSQCNSGHVGMASMVHWTYTAGMHRHLAASTAESDSMTSTIMLPTQQATAAWVKLISCDGISAKMLSSFNNHAIVKTSR